MHLIGKLSNDTPFGSKLQQQKEEGSACSKVASKKGDDLLAPSSNHDHKYSSFDALFCKFKFYFSKLGSSQNYCIVLLKIIYRWTQNALSICKRSISNTGEFSKTEAEWIHFKHSFLLLLLKLKLIFFLIRKDKYFQVSKISQEKQGFSFLFSNCCFFRRSHTDISILRSTCF